MFNLNIAGRKLESILYQIAFAIYLKIITGILITITAVSVFIITHSLE